MSTSRAMKGTAARLRSWKALLLGTMPNFLPLLLTPLFRQLRFCFDYYSFKIVDLAIDEAESRGEDVADGFFGYSL